MSQALAEAEAHVILTGRTRQRVDAAAKAIAIDTHVTGQVMDVRDEQSVSAGVDHALMILDGIDVLVNNAGIGMRTVNPDFMTNPMGFWQVTPDGFRDLLTTNVLGYFLVARAVVPHMLQAATARSSTSPSTRPPCAAAASRPTARPVPRPTPCPTSWPPTWPAPA